MGGWSQSGGQPDFNGYVYMLLGGGAGGPLYPVPPSIGFVFWQNPAYYLDNFQAIYPNFFGPATLVSNASTEAGSPIITVPSTTGLIPGQFLQCQGLPPSSIIMGIGTGMITVNQNALADLSDTSLSVYTAPPIPIMAIQLYINLATASLVQARWQEMWAFGIALFVAHYCTLYAKSAAAEVVAFMQASIHNETPSGAVPGTVYILSALPPAGVLQGFFINGNFQRPGIDYTLSGPNITMTVATQAGDKLQVTWPVQSTAISTGAPSTAQLAAQGLFNGVMSSKSVGDVSASYTVLNEQEGWGTFRTTTFGAQLIDLARVIGSGPALFL
jgi:hypothetical protein